MLRHKRKLLITIDLGNSTAVYGLHSGRRILKTGAVQSDNIPDLIRSIRNLGIEQYSVDYMICSVVPSVLAKLVSALKKLPITNKVYIVGEGVKIRVPMRYKSRSLGADRLVNIYGARFKREMPCLIVDFGTAITFDYLSKTGVFEGGLIVPGAQLALEALQERAELLPKLREISGTRSLLAHDTRSAMCSGLLNGFGALADGLIERFRDRYGKEMRVIATGGFAGRIAPYSRLIRRVDPLHTIKSLALIYENEI